ncbi:MAG: glycosyltransferase family 2 protein [Eubacteriales bacterium]|nr:glycosyltransferase family 2 protein [Eubacteriales bacterium]
MSDLRRKLDKGIAYLRKNGIRAFAGRALKKAALSRKIRYEKWFAAHRLDRAALKELQETAPPLNEFVLLMRPWIEVLEEAEARFAHMAAAHPEIELWYADHDYWLSDGKHCGLPACGPDFDEVYLDSMNYIGGAVLVSKRLIERLALTPADVPADAEGWHDFLKRLTAEAAAVGHIPRILTREPWNYYQEYNGQKKKKAVGKTTAGISVIIPNKDHIQELRQCVKSVLERGGADELEILIVENNSTEAETFAYYEKLKKQDARIRVLTWEKGFNYSAINNFAAEKAEKDLLLFLNNDTEVRDAGCLAELAENLEKYHAAAAGARLLYKEGTIQHAGVVLGFGGSAGHAFEGFTEEAYDQIPFAHVVRQVSAVTAACLLVRKEVFLKAGGFDTALAVAYNDIDFCMKLQKLKEKIIYCPEAVLYHYESATRGLELTPEKAERIRRETALFTERWSEEIAAGDPFYNPNLTLETADYSLKR